MCQKQRFFSVNSFKYHYQHHEMDAISISLCIQQKTKKPELYILSYYHVIILDNGIYDFI